MLFCKKTLSKCFLPCLAAGAIFLSLPQDAAFARDSVFTQKGTGPLYWSSYEYCKTTDGALPEERWQKTIDWLDKDFKQYGYSMVSIDGWGDTKNFNENGYRTKHSSEWKYDYAYWSKYLQNKGMELGIYNNPLWVSKYAVDAGCKVIGTNTPLKDIVSSEDMFADDQYWVNVDHPDAEKYVKGYVEYYKNMGVKFLRVDFLSWYEDGKDKGKRVPWGTDVNHGVARYMKALKWMQEACGNEMELSLVMPHLNGNAAVEMKYGDMARVNEDCGDGGWNRFSDLNRGQAFDYWSKYSNAFDGLIYWSQYFNRGKMIPDADMLRLNTFKNDDERKTAVSLCAIAGAPIDIADQYDTIGNSAWIYQNTEVLDLNREGFVGKPFSSDPKNKESQKWKGQLPDGTWVVGLFNRENVAEERSVDFAKDLGITTAGNVHDVWEHKDLGEMKDYKVKLPAHSCVILKINGNKAAQ